jgi:hypothetical protein
MSFIAVQAVSQVHTRNRFLLSNPDLCGEGKRIYSRMAVPAARRRETLAKPVWKLRVCEYASVYTYAKFQYSLRRC